MKVSSVIVVRQHEGNVWTTKEDSRVLMLRRKDTQCWELPGGAVERGEHPIEAAKRELKEETGIDAGNEQLWTVGAQAGWGRVNDWWLAIVFELSSCHTVGVEAQVVEPDKFDAVGWFTEKEVEDMNVMSLAAKIIAQDFSTEDMGNWIHGC